MHQCINCKKLYGDDTVPIMEGCACGGRLFLFVKHAEDINRVEEIKEELEERIEEIAKEQKEAVTDEKEIKPIKGEEKKFGIETIRIKDIGVYEINIEALMRGRPIVVLSKGGSYIISLPSAFGLDEEINI